MHGDKAEVALHRKARGHRDRGEMDMRRRAEAEQAARKGVLQSRSSALHVSAAKRVFSLPWGASFAGLAKARLSILIHKGCTPPIFQQL